MVCFDLQVRSHRVLSCLLPVRDCVVSLVNVVCLVTITRCTPDSDDGGAGPALFAVDEEGHRKATLALQEHIKPKKAAPAPDRRPSELAQQRRRLHPAGPRDSSRIPVARRVGSRAATGLSLAQLFGR